MAFRIDVNGRMRSDADAERASAIPSDKGEAFRREIALAVRDRQAPLALDEQPVLVEPGDTLSGIAREHHADLGQTLDLNRNGRNRDGDLIHPGELVLVPSPSPALVAATPLDADGVPAGEAVLLDDLHARGNRIDCAEPAEGIDARAETRDLQADVGAYLDLLPTDVQQDAALRLSALDWRDASPAGVAAAAAIEERGLGTDPVLVLADDLYRRGNAIEYAGHGDAAVVTQVLSEDIGAFLETLSDDERAEALQVLFDHDWRDAGPAQMAISAAAASAGIPLRLSGHGGPAVEHAARALIDAAAEAPDAAARFVRLGESYASAAPETRRAIEASPDARALVRDAAASAMQPLDGFDPAVDMQAPPAEAFLRLEEMTKGAPPELAADLVGAATPAIERANALYQAETGASMLGMNGVGSLLSVAGRIAATPQGETVVQRLAALGFYSMHALPTFLGEGGSLAYPLALSAEAGSSTMLLEQDILPGVRQFQGSVGADVDAYSAHMEELRWLVANHGETMSPEALEQAIADYKTEKGAEWAETEERLEAELADSGGVLLERLNELGAFPAEPPEQRQIIEQEVGAILADDRSYLAIQTALQTDPALLENSATLNFLGGTARLTDRGRKLAEEAVTQLVQRHVLPSFAELDAGNPATLVTARNSLAEFRDSCTSALLGVTGRDMDRAIAAVEASFPAPGDTPADAAARMTRLNVELNGLDSTEVGGVRSFASSTVPGQILRTIGLAATGASLVNSAGVAADDPSLKNELKVIVDAAGVAQRSTELLAGMDRIDADSFAARHFDRSAKPAVKFLGVLGAGFDAWNAYDSFRAGDPLMGGLSAAASGGAVMAALGTGSAFGPAGLAVVGLAVAGQMIVTDTRASNTYMNETSAGFLAHAGLDAAVATALVDQSGEGYSPVPLLAEYASQKGFDLGDAEDRTRFVEWLNAIPIPQLERLRGNLHQTLDKVDGDVTRLEPEAADDVFFTDPDLFAAAPPYIGSATPPSLKMQVLAGNAAPVSVRQIDVVLASLGIKLPS